MPLSGGHITIMKSKHPHNPDAPIGTSYRAALSTFERAIALCEDSTPAEKLCFLEESLVEDLIELFFN